MRSRSTSKLRIHASGVIALAVALLATTGAARVYDFVENDDVDFDFSTRKGLRLRFSEPDVRLRLGGRLHADVGFAKQDRTSLREIDGELRRARLYLDARFPYGLRFKIDREFAPDRRGWRNVIGVWRVNRIASIRVGNFVAPFGLEDITASNHSTFMERAVSSALAPAFQTGVMVNARDHVGERKSRHRRTAAAAFTMEPLGHSSNDRHGTEHFGFVTRLTYAPIAKKREVVHVGSALEIRDVRGGSRFRVATRPESSFVPSLLRTGGLQDVDSTVAISAELLVLRGPFVFQSEYVHMFLRRGAGRPDPSFGGGYAQVSFVLMGERRRYSRSLGILGGVRPKSKWGAVELGVRVSVLDLNDERVNGGSTRNVSVALNWYIRENVSFSANYVSIDARLRGTRQEDSPHIGQLRFLLFFWSKRVCTRRTRAPSESPMSLPNIYAGRRKRWLWLLGANCIARAIAAIALAYFLKEGLAQARQGATPYRECLAMVSIGASILALRIREARDAERLGQNFVMRTRLRIFDRLTTRPSRDPDGARWGVTMTRLISDLNSLRN